MPQDEFYKDLPDGMIAKAAEVSAGEVTEEELRRINKYTLEPVGADDVFVFKAVVGDNEIDDRNHEPFTLNALKDLERLYVGKTVIKDHYRRADNQVARIYNTELVPEAKTTGAGEGYAKLIIKAYMIKTPSNADLIAEIKGGIKREVSTGMRPKRAICSICGADNTKVYCPHYPGREYDSADGKKTCTITLDGAKDAYELSFVVAPAQPRAGTIKTYGGAKVEPPGEPSKPEPTTEPEKTIDIQGAELQLRATELFLFAQKNIEGDENHE